MTAVLLIDNVDSFTYNIADLLHRVLGQAPTVWRNDHLAEDLSGFDAIVVGPGPGRPQHRADMGLSILALSQHEVPVLGICLGHQGMAHLAGDHVTELAEPVHGQVSEVEHDGTGLFEGVPSPLAVVRYHSLEVRLAPSSPLQVTSRAVDDGAVMALADPTARRWGVQFHPESVLSEHGERLVANFLSMAGVRPWTPVASAESQAVAIGDVHQHAPAIEVGARVVNLEAVRVGGAVDSWALHRDLLGASPTAFWLDASTAALGDERAMLPQAGRCSVLGDASGPLSYVLTHWVGAGSQLSTGERLDGPLLTNLARLRDRFELCGEIELPTPFRPGFVGYLGYELKAETEGQVAHVSPFPDARLVLADRAVVIDHESDSVFAVWLADEETRGEQEAWVARVRESVAAQRAGHQELSDQSGTVPIRPVRDAESEPGEELDWRHTRAEYLELIAECQRQIRAGESYEICLTNAARWRGRVDETQLYHELRQASPVSFAAWLRGPGLSVLSASPERFVSVSADGQVEARPIKGTRGRGADGVADAALVHELASSIKDRAENLMIVDLLRNDLHRVCRSGSVHVPAIFEVESYASVHQLVSTVRGTLVDGMDSLDVLGTCFPGGSMTGAPKVAAMKILDRLEGGPRGVYSGALGWIGLDGALDLSIVIRTVTWQDGVAEFGVGGAVTALSDPFEEYAETLVKALALRSALRRSTETAE